jgi:hypothetical protein
MMFGVEGSGDLDGFQFSQKSSDSLGFAAETIGYQIPIDENNESKNFLNYFSYSH